MPKRGLKNFISSIFDNGDDAGFDYREPEFGMEENNKDPDEKWLKTGLETVESGDCPYCLATLHTHKPMVHSGGYYYCAYCGNSLMAADYLSWYSGSIPFSELLTEEDKEDIGEDYDDVWNNLYLNI